MRAISSCIVLVGPVLLAGCPKNESAATSTDSAASSAAASVSQVTLAPLDTSSAATATATVTAMIATATPTAIAHGDAAAKPVTTGSTAATTAAPSTQAQLKQCCAALHKQSQQQTPQAAQLAQAAGLCDGLVATMATAQTPPQLDQVKMLLAGVQLPPVCQGL